MGSESLRDALTAVCKRVFGVEASIQNLAQLTGGANQQIWSFDYDTRPLILRRIASEDAADQNPDMLASSAEAAVISAMGRHALPVPAVHGVLVPADNLGSGFVMDRVEGESRPKKLLRDPEFEIARKNFVDDCARHLARLHAIDPETEPLPIESRDATTRVDILMEEYRSLGGNSPILSLALGWLQRNAPSDHPMKIVHGDFRLGNLLINPEGVTAILDWEVAHLGDPVFDLAYLCSPPWRFGNYDRPVGGIGQIEDLVGAYENYSGTQVSMARFHYWLVFASVWWAIVCIRMVEAWRSNAVRTLERSVIGTRVSENELDLLLMLEETIAHSPVPKLDCPAVRGGAYSGSTHPHELAQAVNEWVSSAVIDGAPRGEQFEARIARNALGIVQRNLHLNPEFQARTVRRLGSIGLTRSELAERLYDGSVTLETAGVLEHLRLSALEKIMIDQPNYAAYKIAIAKWCDPVD